MATTFKELLTEAEKATIFTNRNYNGSSLCKELSEKESKMIISTLKDHKKSDFELFDFIESLDPDEKYSETLVIKFQSKVFTLYASYGRLRLGAGGPNLTGCKIIKNININDLNKALKDAQVKSK
jgi:hypothetical protein